MKLMDKHYIEMFDSHIYWSIRELKALEEELAYVSQLSRQPQDLLTAVKKKEAKLRKAFKANAVESAHSLADEIAAIDSELQALYGERYNDDISKMLHASHPYLRFLLQKRFYLTHKQNIQAKFKPMPPEDSEKVDESKKGSIFEMGKWIFNLVNNTWGWFQNTILTRIPPYVLHVLTGILGFLLHLGEGIQGAREAILAYQTEEMPQRKTRLLTHVLSFMAAGAGAGVSLSYLAGTLGAVVTGATLTLGPVLISGLLMSIYGLALWRNSYILYRAKEEEALAQAAYFEASVNTNRIRYEIHELEKKIDASDIQKVLEKISKKQTLTPAETNNYTAYQVAMQALLNQQVLFSQWASALEIKKVQLLQRQEARFQAERTVAFDSIGIAASSLTLVATILGTTVLLGAASIGSFGVVPAALLFVGISIGIACQLFDLYDEKNEYQYTKKWRARFMSFFSKEQGPEEPSLSKTMQPRYVSTVYRQFTVGKEHTVQHPPAENAPFQRAPTSSTFIRHDQRPEEKSPDPIVDSSNRETHDKK